jgi:hypothetical protein
LPVFACYSDEPQGWYSACVRLSPSFHAANLVLPTRRVWREGFQNAAFGNGAVAALSDHRFQFPAQRGQVSQLPLHVRKVFAGDCVNRFAGLLFVVGQIEQRPDFLDGKSEVAGAAGEGEAADMRDRVVL